jgi:hypothetical protein
MSGGGGKGGSQKTQVQIPKFLEDAAKRNLARADEIAQIGFIPFTGPDVASLTPSQLAAMQGTSQAAGAFGLPGGGFDPMQGQPQAQTFAGGVQGLSAAPIFQQALDAFAQESPGQFEAIRRVFLDPVTGAAPPAPFGSPALPPPVSPFGQFGMSEREERIRRGEIGP